MWTRWLWCAWIVFAVACVHDDLPRCDDGRSCPIGTVCHASGCVDPRVVSACADAPELGACTLPDDSAGVCAGGACVAAGCGNGVVESGEQCDDANVLDRDGCAANCLSNETCGNGFIDTLMGEKCDDGNTVDGDGCQAACMPPICGDGVIDADRNEQCDDGIENTDEADRCRLNCQRPRCGDGIPDAAEGCDDGNSVDGDTCRNNCTTPDCGNGNVDAGEECDDGNQLDGDGCQATCKEPVCGDAIRDPGEGEECDAGTAGNSTAADAACRPDCRLPRCGDGVTDLLLGESCDDGDLESGDGCRPNCTAEACGDGIPDLSGMEQCDAGALNSDAPNAPCRVSCALPTCGDGIKDTDLFEECDLGMAMNSASPNALCRPGCRLPRCGDGIADTIMGEQCDGADTAAGETCTALCKLEACGNGVVDPGEQCDAGAANSDDPDAACRVSCTLPRCGDSVTDPSRFEACDAGDAGNLLVGNAACRPGCSLPRCGDGIKDTILGEACDGADSPAGKTCSATCQLQECGNGIIDPDEQCDAGAGNTNQPDAACRPGCTLPTCGDAVRDPALFEECDAGPSGNVLTADAACRPGCRLPRCGDGVADLLAGEQCDGADTPVGKTCSATCRLQECGNSIIDPGETCDAGAANSNAPNAPCRPTCQLPRCGDGVRDTNLFEACDAGAANSLLPNATCRPGCELRRCGDGVIDPAFNEQCDGAPVGGKTCSPLCKLQECGNGVIDPGEQCDDGNASNADTCHTNCQVPRCGDGIPDPQFNELCDAGGANSNAPDAACRLNCRPAFCGDGIPDPGRGEVCDDGNVAFADGCTPDCASDETCGNGYRDIAVGEECDDRNKRSHDTCSSGCLNEFPRWVDATPAPLPARRRHAAAYDAARRRVVVFGGEPQPDPDPTAPAVVFGDTWEFDGAGWLQRRPTSVPPARKDHGMAYDARRGLVYLFGGVTAAGARLNDLWTWNGITWTQITAVGPQPSARSEMAFAYDLPRDRLIVFGGRTAAGFLGDTWVYAGGSWGQLMPAMAPSPRSAPAVAYEPTTGELVIAGGETLGDPAADTWILADTSWRPGGTAPPLRGAAAAWDPEAQAVFLFGGVDKEAKRSGTVYVLAGAGWSAVPAGAGPPPLAYGTLTLLPDRMLVATGGDTAAGVTDVAWRLEGGKWKDLVVQDEPSPRVGAGVAYDPLRGVVVMYGGSDATAALRETWEWNGSSWAPGPIGPEGASRPTMVFSVEDRAVLHHGGSTAPACGGTVLAETHTYDGGWSLASGASGGAMCLGGAAYHAGREAAMKVGGHDGAGESATVYEWSGGVWSQLAEGPEAPVSGRTVAFAPAGDELWQLGGGFGADIIKLDGSWLRWLPPWTRFRDELGPPARLANALVYDPNREGVTVFGGTGVAGPLTDVWFGQADRRWQQITASMPISYAPESPAIVYHDAAAAFVAVAAPLTSAGTTYVMRYESRTPDEACHTDLDRDGDGAPGLDDPDCWPRVNALCPPCPEGASCSCPTTTCGDGICDGIEEARTCRSDCGDPEVRCGDGICDRTESGCPGDCGQ